MSDQTKPAEWLSLKAAAQAANLSDERIRQLCKANQLEYRRPNYHLIEVNAASLSKWMERRIKASVEAAPVVVYPDILVQPDGTLAITTQDPIALPPPVDDPAPYAPSQQAEWTAPPVDDGQRAAGGYLSAYEAELAAMPLHERRRMYQGSWTADDPPALDVFKPLPPADHVETMWIDADALQLADVPQPYQLPDEIKATLTIPSPDPYAPRYNRAEWTAPPPTPALGGQHKRTGTPPPQDWQRVAGKCACAGCDHRPMSRHYAGGSLQPGTRYHGRLRCPVCRAAGCDVDHVRCHITIPDKAGDVVE